VSPISAINILSKWILIREAAKQNKPISHGFVPSSLAAYYGGFAGDPTPIVE
jgi:hypothetical protein